MQGHPPMASATPPPPVAGTYDRFRTSVGSVPAHVPGAAPHAGMTPKELSDFDDVATAALVDPYLGFTTHKMNLRFRSPKAIHVKQLKEAVKRFLNHQNYECAYEELQNVEWFKKTTRRRAKAWQTALKEHVSSLAVLIN